MRTTVYENLTKEQIMFWDDVLFILSIIGILALAIFIIVGGAYLIDKKACYGKYAAYQPEYVGLTTGCMITVDEQRIPAESLRMTM